MNKKFTYILTAVIAVSATAAFAADEAAAEKTIEERLAALESGTEKSNWSENIKIKGDLRYRYEDRDSDQPGISDKSRQRIRVRIGAYGAVNDNVDFGIRLASGNDSPISTNQDIDNYGSSKQVVLDLAYLTVTCPITDVQVTFGKMKQPWTTVSDLVYDSDLNPEGISAAYELASGDVALTLHAGHFILDEQNGDDVQMSSAQIVAETTFAESVGLKAGLNGFIWNNPQDAAIGNGNTGAVDFNQVEGFAQINLKETPLPIKLFADVVQNLGTGVSEDTAWMIGIGTKVGKTSLAYNYRDIELDSIYGDWADSDFHDGGTGGKGHKLSAKYALMKNLSAGATYFITETKDGNDVNTLQLDLVAKF